MQDLEIVLEELRLLIAPFILLVRVLNKPWLHLEIVQNNAHQYNNRLTLGGGSYCRQNAGSFQSLYNHCTVVEHAEKQVVNWSGNTHLHWDAQSGTWQESYIMLPSLGKAIILDLGGLDTATLIVSLLLSLTFAEHTLQTTFNFPQSNSCITKLIEIRTEG